MMIAMALTDPSFMFTKLLTQELNSSGIVSVNGTIVSTAVTILTVMFLLSVYESFAKGGSPQSLILNLVKCGACMAVLSQWKPLFTDVTAGFNAVAGGISAEDSFSTYFSTTLAAQTVDTSKLGQILTLDVISLINGLLVLCIAVVYYLFLYVLMVLYCCWGLVLFTVGPFMVALYPSNATSGFTKQYFKGLAGWAAWPAIYAIFCVLATAIQTFEVPVKFTLANFSDSALKLIMSVIIGIVLACLMAATPFIAHLVVKGDFSGIANGIRQVAMMASMGPGGGAVGMLASGAKGLGGAAKHLGGSAANLAGGGGNAGAGSGGGGTVGKAGGGSSWSTGGAMPSITPPPPTPPKNYK